jgi:hypothetical protein
MREMRIIASYLLRNQYFDGILAGVDPHDMEPLMAIPTRHKAAQARNRFEVTEENYLAAAMATWLAGTKDCSCSNVSIRRMANSIID